MELKISPDFSTLIPPLASDEYNLLQASMIKEGCHHPLVVWDGTLIDGHNRYRICQEHHIDFAVEEKTFDTHEDAIIWICQNQRGRRNITEERKAYLLGKEYEARKITESHNQHTQSSANRQNDGEQNTSSKTAKEIATAYEVNYSTVERSAQFAKGVDAIAAVSPVAKEKILSGQANVTKTVVREARRMGPETVKEIARQIEDGQPVIPEKNYVAKPPVRPPVANTESTLDGIIAHRSLAGLLEVCAGCGHAINKQRPQGAVRLCGCLCVQAGHTRPRGRGRGWDSRVGPATRSRIHDCVCFRYG